MYKSRRRAVIFSTSAVAILIFLVIASYFACNPGIKPVYPKLLVGTIAAIAFLMTHWTATGFLNRVALLMEEHISSSGDTGLMSQFILRLRFCYSLDDLAKAITDILELKGGIAVLYIDVRQGYILYNSPARLTADKRVNDILIQNYAADWKDGYYFLGEELGVVTKPRKARGFFLSQGGRHFFVFCRYTKLFDTIIYPRLYEEYVRFQKRQDTITALSEIAELSKEWQQLADTQRAFLPRSLPLIAKIDFAAVYRPLVNVSGDYYTVLPIDSDKTLIMLGDVSGKGLAAALVMGLVMNTVKIIDNKEDLPSLVKTVDATIKSMHLQDKYTVLFIGVVDTKKMSIQYINASMSDPLVATKVPEGYRIKPLESNCPIVGIIPLDDISVAQHRLFRGDMIFLSSDGISETMDVEGKELGDSALYTDAIKSLAAKSPKEFTRGMIELTLGYAGQRKLHDDITMLVAKIGA